MFVSDSLREYSTVIRTQCPYAFHRFVYVLILYPYGIVLRICSYPLHVWCSQCVLAYGCTSGALVLMAEESVLTSVGYKKRTFISHEDSRKVVQKA